MSVCLAVPDVEAQVMTPHEQIHLISKEKNSSRNDILMRILGIRSAIIDMTNQNISIAIQNISGLRLTKTIMAQSGFIIYIFHKKSQNITGSINQIREIIESHLLIIVYVSLQKLTYLKDSIDTRLVRIVH